jgi:putative phosphoesterase
MRIGVLSDSHGRAPITAHAVAALRDVGAELLIHLGDVCSEAVIDELVGHNAHLVFGNCDLDVRGLTAYAELLGITVAHPMGVLDVADKRIAFTHGDRESLMRQALADGADYLLHGHTHTVRDERVGRARIINPGALFRAARYTVALVEPAADRVQLIEIDPGV